MKRFHLVVLTLALSTALIYGCSGKKEQAEKPQEAAVTQAEAPKPVEPLKAPSPEPSAPGAAKEQAKEAVKAVEKKAVEVKAAAAEKAVEAKAVAKSVEVKAVSAGKAIEEKAVAAEKAVEKAIAPAPSAGDAAAGAAIFKTKCAPCHGTEGKGTTMAPALKGNDWVKVAAVADLTGLIKNGRMGKAKKYPNFFVDMPPSKAMNEADLASLAAYLKSLN